MFSAFLRLLAFPFRMMSGLWSRRELIVHFTWRDFASRYRGSHLGILLSMASPIILLVIYTIVFGWIFQGKFIGPEGPVPFPLALFSALIFFQLFGDSVGRAATLLVENPNFITKVVFPLEILPVSIVGSAFLHFLINAAIMILATLLFGKAIPLTVILLPVVLLPILLFTLGATWFLSSLGIYFRDISALVPPLLMALTFLSGIFYPLSAVPERFQILFLANPMAGFSEMARAILVFGTMPDWRVWAYCFVISVFTFFVGYFAFTRLKKGFSDAL